MKTLKISILSITAAFALASCSHEEIDRFDPAYEALNIGFGNANYLTQDAVYNYSETANERAVKFYARVSGMPVDYDRSFTLEAVSGDLDEAATSYRFETYVIPAGETTGEFEIYFNPANLRDQETSFATEEGEIVFKMVPNEYFADGALNQNELHFTLKNALSKPEYWDTTDSYLYPTLSTYFGEFSLEKFRFMIENGCPVNFRIKTSQTVAITVEGSETLFSTGYATYLKQTYQQALKEYNNTHLFPLMDSHGNMITF